MQYLAETISEYYFLFICLFSYLIPISTRQLSFHGEAHLNLFLDTRKKA
jgi:hypothetical protein